MNGYGHGQSRATSRSLVDFPGTGRAVPQLASIGIAEVRQIGEKPWNIYYKIIDDDIWILSVIDGRRNLEEIIYAKVIEGKRV
jgi:toxin ParE1/3/4